MSPIIIFGFIILNSVVFGKQNYYLNKIFKAHVEKNGLSIFQREMLKSNLDILSALPDHMDHMNVTFRVRKESLKILRDANIPFRQVDIAPSGTVGRRKLVKSKIKVKNLTIPSDPTYDEIVSILQLLPTYTTSRRTITTTSVGKSYQHRDILMVKIELPDANDIMFIDAGIHAREWLSVMTGLYLVVRLVVKEIKDFGVNLYIIPLLNPDGYEYSRTEDRLHRKNMNFEGCDTEDCPYCGVDLNRNFPFKYGVSGASTDHCAEQYRGNGPLSEPESQALAKVLRKYHKNMKAYISLHSYGPLILYPWGYVAKPVDDWEDLEEAGNVAANRMNSLSKKHKFPRYQVKSSGRDFYAAAGGSDDFAKSLGVKYSYTIELQPGGGTGFDPTIEITKKFVKINYHGLIALVDFIADEDNYYTSDDSYSSSETQSYKALKYSSNSSIKKFHYLFYIFFLALMYIVY